MGSDILTMTRGEVSQLYPIKKATWGFARPAPYSVPVLCFAVETEWQTSIFPGEENWGHQPTWHLDIWMHGLNEDQLLPGSQFSIPDWFDEFTGIIYTMFHYDEFEGTQPSTIKIKSHQGDFLDLSIEGFINDKLASMEPTRMTVEARFTKCTPHKEINASFNRQDLPPHEPPYKATYSPPGTT